MFYLEGRAAKEGEYWMQEAAQVALGSCCLRSRCGAVIISKRKPYLIGSGYNSPPGNVPIDVCLKEQFRRDNVKTDLSCCVHAEQRALFDAAENHKGKMPGSRLYFVRIDEKGVMLPSGRPWCTVCSKLSLDKQLAEFTLWHKEDVWQNGWTGICVYGTKEYNDLSMDYWKKKPMMPAGPTMLTSCLPGQSSSTVCSSAPSRA